MKNSILGALIGATIAILAMVIIQDTENPVSKAEPGIILIPESRNIVPGEYFNVYIVPVLDDSPRWFEAISMKAEPQLEATMHSASSKYTLCSLRAPLADSLPGGSILDLEAVVETIQDDNTEGVPIRQSAKMVLEMEGNRVFWTLQ